MPVALYDATPGVAERALERIRGNLEALARAGLASAEEIPAALARVTVAADLASAVARADVVVEAVAEELEVKQRLFAEVEGLVGEQVVLATNTSYFRVTDVGALLRLPGRLVGSHFFLPADVVPLVEVVAGERSDPAVAEAVAALWRRLGKLPILVRKDIPGFAANRLQQAITREALTLLEQGVVSASDLDLAVRAGFGLRYPISGVLEQRDLAGLDLHLAAARRVYPTLSARQQPPPFLDALVAAGETGLRAGRGLYDWGDADPEQVRRRRHEQALALLALVRPWLEQPARGRNRDVRGRQGS
jgi:3-hydroxybutyryl-CoA dehydrogenase